MTDPIADYLTRIRNAYRAGKKVVEIPASNMKLAITKILCEKGYILSYKLVEGTPYNTIKVALKYHEDYHWINYIAGLAVIADAQNNLRYIPVKGAESGVIDYLAIYMAEHKVYTR